MGGQSSNFAAVKFAFHGESSFVFLYRIYFYPSNGYMRVDTIHYSYAHDIHCKRVCGIPVTVYIYRYISFSDERGRKTLSLDDSGNAKVRFRS